MLESVSVNRPACAEILSKFGSFQLSNEELKKHPEFETMCESAKEIIDEDSIGSIILAYLSDLKGKTEFGHYQEEPLGNLLDEILFITSETSLQVSKCFQNYLICCSSECVTIF